MADKEEMLEAFLAGYISSRKEGFTSNSLSDLTRRTATKQFDRWWDHNGDDF
jgi:hypothetical protein